ncbi:MAG: hypothetical protein Kow0020_05140 [Wenzhouxiangellaceae bacterium]
MSERVTKLTLDDEGRLEFPCLYPVKALTRTSDCALKQVLAEIRAHAVVPDPSRITIRPSRHGRFQSLTIEVHAESRAQLEAVYGALRALDVVVMTL